MAPALVAGLVGCERQSPVSGPGVSKSAQSDSISLTVTATPAEADLSQHVRVVLEVVAPADLSVELENYGHELTKSDRTFQFRVSRSSEQSEPPSADGRRRRVQTYDLEFFLAGPHELPGARLTYAKSVGSAGEPSENPPTASLETESLPIVIREPVAARLEPEELRRITVLDPVELPSPWHRWWPAALPAAAVAAAWFWFRRRRRREAAAPPIPAHEWALAELARLVADDLVGHGLLQEYFYRISDVVRGYIERRFDVSAPEMTTEEFLAAASRDHRFESEHTDALTRFLTECDLVKYARHQPTTAECDGVHKAARRFIERTRVRLYVLPGEGAAPVSEEKAA
jgi:hypothetical protein